MSPLEVTIDATPERVRVALAGELDIATGSRLEDELARVERDEPPILVIDLRGLEFMDSTGLRILLAAATRASDAGRRFVLVRGNQWIQRVLGVTGLDQRLEIVDHPDAADGGG